MSSGGLHFSRFHSTSGGAEIKLSAEVPESPTLPGLPLPASARGRAAGVCEAGVRQRLSIVDGARFSSRLSSVFAIQDFVAHRTTYFKTTHVMPQGGDPQPHPDDQ